MSDQPLKRDLHRYLLDTRESLVWKLDGLGEYDVRRPLTPTGTNLLGLVKHVAAVEALYLGWAFGRSIEPVVPWCRPDLGPGAFEPNADLWATADESREHIVGTYRRVWRHVDETIESTDLQATGFVPWFAEADQKPTLHRVLVHVLTEISRHAGHADIVRESIDGGIGTRTGDQRLPARDPQWWVAHHDRVDEAALTAAR